MRQPLPVHAALYCPPPFPRVRCPGLVIPYSKVRNKRSGTQQGPTHKNDKVAKRRMKGGSPPRNDLRGGTLKVKRRVMTEPQNGAALRARAARQRSAGQGKAQRYDDDQEEKHTAVTNMNPDIFEKSQDPPNGKSKFHSRFIT